MNCKSCHFPIGEQETTKSCSVCNGATHAFCVIKEGELIYCDSCFIEKDKPKKETFELPDHIRRTHIETYRKCPRKFMLEVLKDNPMPDNPYTRVGSDLHELFEKAILNRSYNISQFKLEYDVYEKAQIANGLYKDGGELKSFQKRAEESVDEFYKVITSIPPAWVTEETIFYSVAEDLPKVRFTMDLITENENGNLDLHDWKTGKVMVGKTISSDLQAPIYIYGVEQHYGRQVDSFTFYYLKERKTRTFRRVQANVYECVVGKRSYFINTIDTIRELQSIFNQMKKGNWNVPQQGMFFTCKMCHLKEQGLCEGADNESWNQLQKGIK